jgi:hypothetical protein
MAMHLGVSAMPQDRPIAEAYWVLPGRLLAGDYPGGSDEGQTRDRLRRLLLAGVGCFVDLTEPGEFDRLPYDHLAQEEARALGRDVTHRRMSIPDRGTPTPGDMAGILATIDAALARGQVVYVHCYAGIGRTGTVVGCYLVQHGMSGDQALTQIARLRQEVPDAWVRSPETEAQRRMVRSWQPRAGSAGRD